ncbi:DUF2778 domain-containing protein [Pararhizobium antarcticum]|uniref:Tlde1 domain-containing protein n=1 Tax=Pararhizobium antarcticum TaxID=1798805 RepID=A0A657LNN3_9HYPH|nr:DUF2778 domain-containing protein [Pararhizobium antarcticum]OJF91472.1 hypothetical protein AX760_23440 [Pararhizobium antarcticum]OJG00369.1 hypothetical protein AX761_09245 [Rhizobium sp. 58]
MASAVQKFSSIVPRDKAARRTSARRFLSGASVIGFAAAVTVWVVATVAAMHAAGPSLPSDRPMRLEASLGLNPIIRAVPQERTVRLAKFSRLTVLPRINLIATAQAGPHKASVAVAMAMPGAVFAEKMQALAKLIPARDRDLITGSTPITASALVEPVSLQDDMLPKPFNLVMSDQAVELSGLLPDMGPLPLRRPAGSLDAALGKPGAKDTKPKVRELAYAKPGLPDMDDEDDIVRPAFRGKKGVAYYDISAGVVHMPNGERLEAHSGIGKMRDNPDFAHVKMRGPTPPGTYKVTMREALFHGVEAVRLTPTDGVAPLGRTGLLAHSYLLRTPGDSHGCVAFANYPKFLKAFKRGEISHMVIVKSMKGGFSKPNKTLASLFGSSKDR